MVAILQSENGWLRFATPHTVVSASRLDDVLPVLTEVERLVNAKHWHACGFIAYDAAPAFDPALKARQTEGLPLLYFALCDAPVLIESPPSKCSGGFSLGPWEPAIQHHDYDQAFSAIKDYIRTGHTYQVNYTYPLTAKFDGNAQALFAHLIRAQQPRFGAWISAPDWTVCSASPELFFSLDGDHLITRPMKGTAARGLTSVDDDRAGAKLRQSEKNRAENIMIVDMLRNDLGRVARPGSVVAKPLFTLERYPNVFQLTSTVRCQTVAPITRIMQALFPCASVTGAPKARATEIIHDLEPNPRGIYTGAIGYIGPHRQAQFSVAIRTVTINNRTGQASFGVGSGVVWDSESEAEYTECLDKAAILSQESPPPFKLLETMLWTPEDGWFLLESHLNRLRNSARYFGFSISLSAIQEKLNSAMSDFGKKRRRCRLLLSRDGTMELQSRPISTNETNPERVRLAASPIDRLNSFLYHKTTHRAVYERALATTPDAEVVLLWNREGEVTEAAIANLVYRLGGRLYTPPIRSGLLPGVYRAHLLAQKKVHQRPLCVTELAHAEKLFLVNSVRGQWEVRLD